MEENYYELLGVPENASLEEIKKAFRELAKKYHPDVGGDQEKFKKILEAYRVLSDPKLRAEYDQRRKMGNVFTSGDFNVGDFGSLFDYLQKTFFSDELEDLLTDWFQFERNKPKINLDIVKEVDLNLEEAILGTKRLIRYSRKIKCFVCDGTGSQTKELIGCSFCGGSGRVRNRKNIWSAIVFEELKKCSNCQGSGRIPKVICYNCQGEGLINKTEEIQIEIPASLGENKIKLPNLGNQDKYNHTGDLIIYFNLKLKPPFYSDGERIIYEAKISFIDALLGKTIYLPWGRENIKIDIPAMILPNFLLKTNKSIMHYPVYVKIEIQPPKKLSPRAKKLIEELKRELE